MQPLDSSSPSSYYYYIIKVNVRDVHFLYGGGEWGRELRKKIPRKLNRDGDEDCIPRPPLPPR